MTDRELLELAAKAAGIDVDGWISGSNKIRVLYPRKQPRVSVGYKWNPLTDDGDAFRLAVKLELGVAIFSVYVEVTDGLSIDASQKTEADPYAATRRAIVRVAAEIGAKP